MAFAAGVGVYLLDRAKLRNSWLDPADREAHPERFAFIRDHAGAVRGLAVLLLVGAGAIAAEFAPPRDRGILEAVPLVAFAGVVAYAAMPRGSRPRIKDVLIVKNAYVALGITGFAALMSWLWFPAVDPVAAWRSWAFAAAVVAIRVVTDAMLCDLDDLDADARHATRTLPGVLGRARTRDLVLALQLAISLALVLAPLAPMTARVAWGAATAVGAVAIRLWPACRLRDPVDLGLAVQAAVVAAVLGLV
ncbi:MAG: hypothetical protein H6810_12440 [Phycisphaeraceae bacterium]|nr:MAG: hypothetical protein H6810_12440 [Phycisphaeraceae bacterium]